MFGWGALASALFQIVALLVRGRFEKKQDKKNEIKEIRKGFHEAIKTRDPAQLTYMLGRVKRL